ncbi:Ribokinase-like protein [Melanogaster broomeanus]|nr:Ribokinase-like protein [Melanogaster broomeanus]
MFETSHLLLALCRSPRGGRQALLRRGLLPYSRRRVCPDAQQTCVGEFQELRSEPLRTLHPQFFSAQLEQVLPYCDIVIGNESEAQAYAKSVMKVEETDLVAIAKGIATYKKDNARPRIAIITQGPESTILVSSADPTNAKVYSVTPIASEQIVDTNGAGDAFAGGFLGAFALEKSLDECVEVGHRMGAMCVQLVGPQFKWPKGQRSVNVTMTSRYEHCIPHLPSPTLALNSEIFVSLQPTMLKHHKLSTAC